MKLENLISVHSGLSFREKVVHYAKGTIGVIRVC